MSVRSAKNASQDNVGCRTDGTALQTPSDSLKPAKYQSIVPRFLVGHAALAHLLKRRKEVEGTKTSDLLGIIDLSSSSKSISHFIETLPNTCCFSDTESKSRVCVRARMNMFSCTCCVSRTRKHIFLGRAILAGFYISKLLVRQGFMVKVWV